MRSTSPSVFDDDVISRYWETVRHLSARQVWSRVRLRAAAQARRRFPAAALRALDARGARTGLQWRDAGLGRQVTESILRIRGDEGAGLTAEDIAAGRFRFLNEAGELGWPPDWAAPQNSQLWRYHLHYFDFLPPLASTAPLAVSLVADWIAANPAHGNGSTPDAWHPYVASVRLVNWMLAFSAMPSGESLPPAIGRSLVTHAVFLDRNLETDVGGNHLLKNLKAMVFAGCFWEGSHADDWRRRYGRAFTDELSRQVLPDGGHYERSPMYHCQVLSDALEVTAVLSGCRDEHVERLHPLVARMDRFLELVTHPDGEIALVNDSALGMAPSPASLHDAIAAVLGAPRAGQHPFPARELEQAARASGYVPLPAGDPSRYLLADVGAVCPDDLPAHAHADLLSFELSLGQVRMIVDSGVGEYARGPWRDYYRSTRAHNTVMVDQREQSDCWASFRVGHRARPAHVSYAHTEGHVVLEAEHTGYDRLSSAVRHRRRFVWVDDGDFWIVDDTLAGASVHEWASFCHVHRDARVERAGERSARITRGETVLDVCWFGFESFEVICGGRDPLQGWSAEQFGAAVPAPVIVLRGRRVLPAAFGYALVPQRSADAIPASIALQSNGRLVVSKNQRSHDIPRSVSAGAVRPS